MRAMKPTPQGCLDTRSESEVCSLLNIEYHKPEDKPVDAVDIEVRGLPVLAAHDSMGFKDSDLLLFAPTLFYNGIAPRPSLLDLFRCLRSASPKRRALMRLGRSSVAIWNRSWIEVSFCNMQAFNVRLG